MGAHDVLWLFRIIFGCFKSGFPWLRWIIGGFSLVSIGNDFQFNSVSTRSAIVYFWKCRPRIITQRRSAGGIPVFLLFFFSRFKKKVFFFYPHANAVEEETCDSLTDARYFKARLLDTGDGDDDDDDDVDDDLGRRRRRRAIHQNAARALPASQRSNRTGSSSLFILFTFSWK